MSGMTHESLMSCDPVVASVPEAVLRKLLIRARFLLDGARLARASVPVFGLSDLPVAEPGRSHPLRVPA